MPIFITEAGFPDSGLQVWKLLEYGFLGYGNGNPWVMLEATFHGIVFAQLIYRTPSKWQAPWLTVYSGWTTTPLPFSDTTCRASTNQFAEQ